MNEPEDRAASTRDAEIAELRRRLDEAEQAIRALAAREIDTVAADAGFAPALLLQAQRELRSSQRRLEAIFEASADAILLFDDSGRYRDANRAATELLGLTRDELLGKTVGCFLAEPEDGPRYVRRLVDAGTLSGEDDIVTPYRGRRTVAFRSVASILPGLHMEILRDVTDEHRIQAQLLIADRMASIGTMAAGVAHEINNPLAAAMANLQLALKTVERLDPDGEVAQELRDALDGAERVRVIVRDLSIFSRGDQPESFVDVRALLEATLRVAANEIRQRARLVEDYGPTPPVRGNPARLGQVFLNILVNAMQAIPEGQHEVNELRVTTRTDEGGQVIVEIADTGHGMPPEVLRRLFTPFFTTKPVGQGTGLGLSMSQRIVSGLGGRIEVESEVGRGSRFRVYLPPAGAAPIAAASAGPAERARQRGRVLVVDDDALIARSVTRLLAARHDVVAVTSAREALDRIVAGDRFDAILCDVMMPQMTGIDLHAELLRAAPDQAARMIFTTSGAFTPGARRFVGQTTNPTLYKPFDARRLEAVVDETIDASAEKSSAQRVD